MRDKILKEALTKTGKINHHFINRLTNDEINEIIKLTDFTPKDTPIKIRVKFLLDGITKYPKCKICDGPVRPHFKGLTLLDTCSKECDYLHRVSATKKSNLESYGVESTNQLDSIRLKQKESMVMNHGSEYYVLSNEFTNKSDKTKLNRYGNKKYVNHKKAMNTKLKRYGNKFYNNHEKYIETCLERYGVEHVMQNETIFKKQQANCYGSKKYKHLYYRGTYELLFIQEFEKNFDICDLENCFSIKYEYNNKMRVYFPDFLIKSKNIIVEIKSSWTYDNNGKNIELRDTNNRKWEAAKSLSDYTFFPLKSKDEIKLFTNVLTHMI